MRFFKKNSTLKDQLDVLMTEQEQLLGEAVKIARATPELFDRTIEEEFEPLLSEFRARPISTQLIARTCTECLQEIETKTENRFRSAWIEACCRTGTKALLRFLSEGSGLLTLPRKNLPSPEGYRRALSVIAFELGRMYYEAASLPSVLGELPSEFARSAASTIDPFAEVYSAWLDAKLGDGRSREALGGAYLLIGLQLAAWQPGIHAFPQDPDTLTQILPISRFVPWDPGVMFESLAIVQIACVTDFAPRLEWLLAK